MLADKTPMSVFVLMDSMSRRDPRRSQRPENPSGALSMCIGVHPLFHLLLNFAASASAPRARITASSPTAVNVVPSSM